MSKINVKLLRKIQKHILEEPKRLIMNDVIVKAAPGTKVRDYRIEFKAPSCGTTACVAGWALLLSGRQKTIETFAGMKLAGERLGIEGFDEDGDPEYFRLFRVEQWPEKYSSQWLAAETPRQRARVAVNRIDHYIKTNGAE